MLTDEQKAEGWIEHRGGPCPHQGACLVALRGNRMIPFVSYLFEGWEHKDEPRWFDVIAYLPENPND